MSLVMRRRGQVVVGLRSGGRPSDEEWSRWLALITAEPTQRVRLLIEAHGSGAPDASQRKRLSSALRRLVDYESALISESILERGVLIALSWLRVRISVFGPHQYDAAIAHLGLRPEEAEWAMSTLNELRLETGIAELLGEG